MMNRVGRVALCALLVSGLGACKKEDKKEGEAAKPGSASASGTGTGTGTGTGAAAGTDPAKTEGGQAMAAIKGAIARNDQPTSGGGGLGGMGAALGGLFGGGGGAAAAAAPMGEDKMDAKKVAIEPEPGGPAVEPSPDDAPTPELPSLKFPVGKAGGDCNAVGDRIVTMMETLYGDPDLLMSMAGASMDGMDEETKKIAAAQMKSAMEQMKQQIPEIRQQVVSQCETQKWSQELKDCALTTEDLKDFPKCEQFMTEEQKRADFDEDPPEPPPPAEPVPAWSGGSDCNAVGERIIQLAMASAGEMDAAGKASMEEMMKEAVGEITTMCTQGNWSDDNRQCFLKAGTIQDAEACFDAIGGM